jgi:hypothetical protein
MKDFFWILVCLCIVMMTCGIPRFLIPINNLVQDRTCFCCTGYRYLHMIDMLFLWFILLYCVMILMYFHGAHCIKYLHHCISYQFIEAWNVIYVWKLIVNKKCVKIKSIKLLTFANFCYKVCANDPVISSSHRVKIVLSSRK